MLKSCLLILSLITTAVLFSGCQERLPDVSHSVIAAPPGPQWHDGLDEVLAGFAVAQFDESRRFSYGVLYRITRFYMPFNVPEDFPLTRIGIDARTLSNGPISFNYSLHNSELPHRISRHGISFTWHRDRRTSETFFHSHEIERNSAPWLRYWWSQDQYEFSAYIPTEFIEEDFYDLINALTNPQPLIAWEIKGNAVSVSIQGTESVTIFDENGYEVVSKATTEHNNSIHTIRNNNLYTVLTMEHHSLFKINGESLGRVGYSWLVDADLSRRQYVLKPGVYTFYVKGVIGEPDLLIRHFAEREIVSSVSYSAELTEQSFSSFTVIVTPDSSGSGDTVVIDPSNF